MAIRLCRIPAPKSWQPPVVREQGHRAPRPRSGPSYQAIRKRKSQGFETENRYLDSDSGSASEKRAKESTKENLRKQNFQSKYPSRRAITLLRTLGQRPGYGWGLQVDRGSSFQNDLLLYLSQETGHRYEV